MPLKLASESGLAPQPARTTALATALCSSASSRTNRTRGGGATPSPSPSARGGELLGLEHGRGGSWRCCLPPAISCKGIPWSNGSLVLTRALAMSSHFRLFATFIFLLCFAISFFFITDDM